MAGGIIGEIMDYFHRIGETGPEAEHRELTMQALQDFSTEFAGQHEGMTPEMVYDVTVDVWRDSGRPIVFKMPTEISDGVKKMGYFSIKRGGPFVRDIEPAEAYGDTIYADSYRSLVSEIIHSQDAQTNLQDRKDDSAQFAREDRAAHDIGTIPHAIPGTIEFNTHYADNNPDVKLYVDIIKRLDKLMWKAKQ